MLYVCSYYSALISVLIYFLCYLLLSHMIYFISDFFQHFIDVVKRGMYRPAVFFYSLVLIQLLSHSRVTLPHKLLQIMYKDYYMVSFLLL